MRIASAFALLLLALCLSAPLALTRAACADVLWDNGDPDFVDGYCCQRVGAVPVSDVADDFHSDEAWIITGAYWETVDDPDYAWDGTGDMIIYEFTAAGPGAPIVELWDVPNTREYLGEFSLPWYGYTIDLVALGMEFDLPAGDYFILLRPYTPGSAGQSFWLTSPAPLGSQSEFYFRSDYFGYPDWVPATTVSGQPYDVNFKLMGEMFEPGSPDAVIDLPADDITIYPGDYVEFAGTATDEDGEIVDWLWTFGEGSGIDDMHVEDPGLVQFNNVGVFTVTFNAQDNDGNWDPIPDERTVWVRGVLYVDRDAPGPTHDGLTWDTAFLTIQEGVDAVPPGGEVWVADGVYVENVVMGEGVAIYGGFLGAEPGGYETELDQRDFVNNVTTIDGNQSGSCVVMAIEARVDGFTVTNGSGTEGHDGYLCGGGFYCRWLGETGAIVNNAITGNSGELAGGGIWCELNSSPAVIRNAITGNTAWWAGGIGCYEGPPVLIGNNIIAGNVAGQGGGGIFCQDCSATVTTNIIAGNSAYYGGGVCLIRSSSMITSNMVTYNSAELGGGIMCNCSTPTVTNNIIGGNSAAQGGGLYSYDLNCSPTLANNTIAGNSAGLGRALACDHGPSEVEITNCILWNGGDEIWNNDGSTITITYSDVWGGWPSEGNIDADPRFVDAQGGDFHLNHGSPCIDAGNNDAPDLPEYDFEGDPRIMDGDGDDIFIVDIGADEHPPDECVFTEAPDPEPYCEGALFGQPASGYPGWVWFSIPLDPADCCAGADCYDPSVLLGFSCGGRLWYWDKYGNWAQVYQPPFLEWELTAGDSYLLYLETAVENPAYHGVCPEMPFEFRLGSQGWTWIGMPGLAELGYPDFMSQVQVEYPVGGVIRTADEDYNETPNNWMSWGWTFWDTYGQAPQTFTPYAEFGRNTCYPWIGYRVWVNVGTAQSPDDPDQVTLIWP